MNLGSRCPIKMQPHLFFDTAPTVCTAGAVKTCADTCAIRSLSRSVVDELVLVAPAIELSDLSAYLLRGVLSSKLSHSLEVDL